jgi:hypothetical protein
VCVCGGGGGGCHPRGGGGQTANTKHELCWEAPEGADTCDVSCNGSCDSSSKQQCTQEFKHSSDDNCRPELEGFGAHTGTETVCHVVCTDAIGIHERDDRMDHDQVGVLLQE